MKRLLVSVSLAVLLGALLSAGVIAQSYPTKSIRIIAPFPPGGTSDTIARILGQKLTEAWKHQTIVDNRGGVAGSLGSAIAAKAPADGYTLLVGNVGPVAINHNIYRNVGYDPIKDFAPISLAVSAPQIVVVHPSVPARTFKEFAALVKAQKGKINFGTSGPGSISHLSVELYKRMTGTDMLHVPFKGSALITIALLSG
ncbi:MAG: tripartite tricarboxylate transporter substrate binding protein, partial [Pseudomonadota bacterium]